LRAISTVVAPPFAWMMKSLALSKTFVDARLQAIEIGRHDWSQIAVMTVVEARSYSRYSGLTRCDWLK